MEKLEYSDEQKNALFEAIYLGVITLGTLPKNLYNETAKVLRTSLYKGYGGTLLDFEFGKPDYELLKQLRENIYVFSGAKTATQVEDIKSLMYDGDKVLTLAEFKKVALPRFETYNGKSGYLESEYITAHTTAGSAANFQYSLENSELFPYITSVAIIDQYTAIECERMNGVTALVSDPIWNHNLAARHFKCRCHETKQDKYDKVTLTPKSELKNIMELNDKDMDPVFKMNPVYDKVIFNEHHQYFEIGKRNPDLAKNNFNLKIPKTDAKQREESI